MMPAPIHLAALCLDTDIINEGELPTTVLKPLKP